MTMTNAVIECILSRSAVKYYDPAATLSDDEIRELVRIGTTAPTSFHLQNWRFIAVRTPEAKARLRPIAWNQPATTDAAVTFIVCGQLGDSSVIPKRLAPLVEAGRLARSELYPVAPTISEGPWRFHVMRARRQSPDEPAKNLARRGPVTTAPRSEDLWPITESQ